MKARSKRLSVTKPASGRRLAQSTRLIGAYVLMLTLVACASAGGAPSLTSMAEFAKQNPDCELWTNWEEMCSRTGENGAPYCVKDAGMPVKPSEPFCTDTTFGYTPYKFSAKQTESLLRFCDDTTVVEGDRTHIDKAGDRTLCVRFREDRPFNGRRLAARRHPWCSSWASTLDDSLVCSEAAGGNAQIGVDAANCEELARQDFTLNARLYCAEETVPEWCRKAISSYDSAYTPAEFRFLPKESLALDFREFEIIQQLPLPMPVLGVQCFWRR